MSRIIIVAALLAVFTPGHRAFGGQNSQYALAVDRVKGKSSNPIPVADDRGREQLIPQFDVVAIKRSRPGDNNFKIAFTPSGFHAENAPIVALLRLACSMFNSLDDSFTGLPDWTKAERYDIDAKVAYEDLDAFHKLNKERIVMLHRVFEERFNLKTHQEDREQKVYILTVAKGGSRLSVAKTEDASTNPVTGKTAKKAAPVRFTLGHLVAPASTMEQFQTLLGQLVGRPVVNRTGLPGEYDIELTWTPEAASPDGAAVDPAGLTIFTALQEQLGLKLESGKDALPTLVVDHIERPTEN